MNILVVRTDFSHHGENSGYKQLLRFIQPKVVLGVDERSGLHTGTLKGNHQWLFEFEIRKHLKGIDVIHLMYGEDYLRFSPYLYRKIPVVATFHQPADALEREITRGDLRGRIARFTHLLTRRRFAKLAAAIVTDKSQKKVLSAVMPEERIHVIPLGVNLSEFRSVSRELREAGTPLKRTQILTVGNWLRDWDFYIRLAEHCRELHPEWEFHLVNRRMDSGLRQKLNECPNLVVHGDLTDRELKILLYESALQLLPVTGASGNNALLESLAMGCPVVITDVFPDGFIIDPPAVSRYIPGDLKDAVKKMESIIGLDEKATLSLKEITFARADFFDWKHIGEMTMNVYQSVLKK